jgi:hypothetical protein
MKSHAASAVTTAEADISDRKDRSMRLMLIARWFMSGGSGCPSVYATEDPDTLVIQGNVLDPETRNNLQQVLDGEDAVAIPTETILRAARIIQDQK